MSSFVYIEDREHPGPGGGTRQRAMSTSLELREVTPGRATSHGPYSTLEGRAVPYGEEANLRWFLESHDPASLKKTTAGAAKQAPLLLFHNNQTMPIGHAEQWSHSADGLDGLWRLNSSREAQEAASRADSGDLTGLSIGFVPIRSKWEFVDDWDPDLGEDHMDRVTRLESRLIEVSITPTPAFSGAQVASIRQSPDGMMVDGMTMDDYRQLRAHLGPPTPRLDEWRRFAATL